MSQYTNEIWGLHSDGALRNAVRDILAAYQVSSIVETGTFFGSSTAFFAGLFPGKVYSCETHDGAYMIANEFFKGNPNVEIAHEDSPVYLGWLHMAGKLGDTPLIFLDAHIAGYDPLEKELAILGEIPQAIIILDDQTKMPPLAGINRCLYPTNAANPHVIIFHNLMPPALQYYA